MEREPFATPVRSPGPGFAAGPEARASTLPSYLFPGATPTPTAGSSAAGGPGGPAPLTGGWGGALLRVPGSPLAAAPLAATTASSSSVAGGGGMAPPVGDLYDLLGAPAAGPGGALLQPTVGPASWNDDGSAGSGGSGELGRWVVAFGFGAGAAGAVLRALAAAGDVSGHRPGAGNYLYVQFASPLAAAAAAARPVRLLPGGLLVGVLPAAQAPVPPPPAGPAPASAPRLASVAAVPPPVIAPLGGPADPLAGQGRSAPPPAAAASLPARLLEYLFAL